MLYSSAASHLRKLFLDFIFRQIKIIPLPLIFLIRREPVVAHAHFGRDELEGAPLPAQHGHRLDAVAVEVRRAERRALKNNFKKIKKKNSYLPLAPVKVHDAVLEDAIFPPPRLDPPAQFP